MAYPPFHEIPQYFEQMRLHYNKIVFLMRTSPQNKDKIVKELALYVQLGAITHLFRRANMSVFMLQTNGILAALGLPTIYHGYLDLIACALQPEQFVIFFEEYISDSENQVTEDQDKRH